MRPHDLPPIDRYKHGTRARYVAGCRCDDCRNANRLAYHARRAKAREAAAALPTAAPAPIIKPWTSHGAPRVRTYRRACPGLDGQPCLHRSHLRKDSGPVCARCRDRFIWNGPVDATPARKHLARLRRQGVGLRAVEAATDIARVTLSDIARGDQLQLRRATERKILDVDRSCIGDGALVPAGPSWRLLRRLIDVEGYPAVRLVRLLGMKSASGLQFPTTKITARSARRIEQLYTQLTAEA